MGCGPPSSDRVVQKIQGGSSPTMISEWGVTPLLQQGGSSPTMISEWGVTPLLQQGGLKNTRWFISHYDIRMGCDAVPPFATGLFKVVHLRKKSPPQQQAQQQQQLGSLHDLSAFGRRKIGGKFKSVQKFTEHPVLPPPPPIKPQVS